jgi:hypothetical protein
VSVVRVHVERDRFGLSDFPDDDRPAQPRIHGTPHTTTIIKGEKTDVVIDLEKRVHLRHGLFDAERKRVRSEHLFLISRMASLH